MAEFVCPECGSIERGAEAVKFPYQCPGCDSLINASGEAIAPEPGARVGPIKVELLKTSEWNRAKRFDIRRILADRRMWLLAAAAVVILGAIGIAWFRSPQPAEDWAVQAREGETQASPGSATPGRHGNNAALAKDQKAGSNSSPGASGAQQGTASARTEEMAGSEAESGASQVAVVKPPSAELTQEDLRKGVPRGMRTAVPLYPDVPLLRQPRPVGRAIQILKEWDLLVVVDSKPESPWICVMSMASGREGWVRADKIKISEGN